MILLKRVMTLALVFCLLLLLFASAEDMQPSSAQNVSSSPLALQYSEIDALVRSGNPTIRMNQNTIKTLENPDGVKAARDKIFTEAAKVQMGVNQMIAATNGAVSASLLELSYLASTLKAQGQQMSIPDEEQVERTALQLDQVNDTMVSIVQNLFLSYLSAERQLDELQNNLALVNKNLEVLTLRQELEQVTALDVSELALQKSTLSANITILESSLANIKGEINIQLGRPYDAVLNLVEPNMADTSYLDEIDFAADWQKAKEANYALKLQRLELADLDETEYEDQQYQTFQLQRENSVLQLQSDEENLRFAHKKAYDEIENNQQLAAIAEAEYQQAQQTLEVAQTKYDLGLISQVDLMNSQATVRTKENNWRTAQYNVLTAVLSYQSIVNGLTPASQSGGGFSSAESSY